MPPVLSPTAHGLPAARHHPYLAFHAPALVAPTPSSSSAPFAAYRKERQDTPKGRLAAVYRRESEATQTGAKRRGETRGTLEDQWDDAVALAADLGLDLSQDRDYLELEQGDVWARPALQKLLRDVGQGKFGHLIVWHPDRLSRDSDIRGSVRQRLRSAGVTLHYVQVPEAAQDTVEGRVSDAAHGIASMVEKDRIRQRTQVRRQARARSGKLIAGGYPKYGYNWVLDARHRILTYEVDPETAPVVRTILEQLAGGTPIKRVIHDLNAQGVPTRGEILRRRGLLSPALAARVGNHWTRNMVAEIVYTPDYSGTHLNYHTVSEYEEVAHPLTGLARRKRTQMLRKSTREHLPLEDLLAQYGEYAMEVPAIVDRETHLAAQEWFRSRKRSEPRGDHEDALLAGGYVRCAYCLRGMFVQRDNKRPTHTRYFRGQGESRAWTTVPVCPAHGNIISVGKLDREVWEAICDGLKSPEVLGVLLERARDAVGEHEGHTLDMLGLLRQEKAQAEADLEGLLEQAKQPGMPEVVRAALTAKMAEVGRTLESVEGRLAATQVTQANQEAYLERVQEVRDWAATLSTGLDALDYGGRRRVLFMLGVQVYVARAQDQEKQAEPAFVSQGHGRWFMQTDFGGLNLGARLGTDVYERYTGMRTNNNARNYGIVNALDLQELLGQPLGKGQPLPEGVLATLRERTQQASDAAQ